MLSNMIRNIARFFVLGVIFLLSSCEIGSLFGGGTKKPSSDLLSSTDNTSWISNASMIIPRIDASSVVLDGKIYVIGGYSGSMLKQVEVFDPIENSWTLKASLKEARRNFVSGVIGGKIYVSGGLSYSDYMAVTMVRSTEVYDPTLDCWSTVDCGFPFHQAYESSLGNVCVLGGALNEKLYVFVGNTGFSDRTEGYYLDIATTTWTPTAQPPSILYGSGSYSAAVLSEKVYIYCYSKLASYDPVGDYWVLLPNAPISSNEATLVSSGNYLYAIGGEAVVNGKLGVIDRVQQYSPSAANWGVKYSLPEPRTMVSAVTLGSTTYVLGGSAATRYSSGSILNTAISGELQH